MDLKLILTVFGTVFLAEIGDKTQLATMLFASNVKNCKWSVFIGSASALILASVIGVSVGSVISGHIDTKYLSWIAGAGFIGVGVWTILKA